MLFIFGVFDGTIEGYNENGMLQRNTECINCFYRTFSVPFDARIFAIYNSGYDRRVVHTEK